MKTFKYRLQSYLRLIAHQKDEALREAKVAENKKRDLEDRLKKMKQTVTQSFQFNSQLGTTLHDVHRVQDSNQFLQLLKRQMKELSHEIVLAEEQYQEKYKKFLEIQVEYRKLELHKEQQKENYKIQVKKTQQKFLDDMNASRMGEDDAESLS